jgi:uncharacterized membrane protein
MNATASSLPRKPAPWLPTMAVVVLLIPLFWFLRQKLHYYVDISADSYSGYFWPRRAAVIPHVFGGLVAITTGLVQIWLGLTNRIGALHRTLGKVYVAGVAVGSLGGFYMAFTIPPGAPVYQAGLAMLCVAWVLTTGMALRAIRNRRIEQHREWMLRSYVVTFAFVTYRLGESLLRSFFDQPNVPGIDDIATLMSWACWAVPLLLAEPLIQWRAARAR